MAYYTFSLRGGFSAATVSVDVKLAGNNKTG